MAREAMAIWDCESRERRHGMSCDLIAERWQGRIRYDMGAELADYGIHILAVTELRPTSRYCDSSM